MAQYDPAKEIWKPIDGFDKYFISNEGRVKSFKSGNEHILNPKKFRYKNVTLRKDNKGHTKSIHRLVALHFIENLENKIEVNHINGIKDDNRVENLEWCTKSENSIHALKNGLAKSGENSKKHKLTEKQVKEIKNSSLKGVELSKIYNIGEMQISRIKNNINWKYINL